MSLLVVERKFDYTFHCNFWILMHDIQAHLSCPEFTVHFLQDSKIQAFFAAEVVIDHPLACACTLRNHIDTRAAEPDRRKLLGRYAENVFVGSIRIMPSAGRLHAGRAASRASK